MLLRKRIKTGPLQVATEEGKAKQLERKILRSDYYIPSSERETKKAYERRKKVELP